MSRLDLIAGPNGAGKTTFFDRIIRPSRPGLPFVNADDIAAVKFPGAEVENAYEAARRAAATRRALIAAGIDFCTETVFSHQSKVDLVTHANSENYDVVLHVIMIPLELSARRVAARVDAGGHDVPYDKLEPRYDRLWPLVAEAIPACHRAVFWNNATHDGPREVASFRSGIADAPPRWPAWSPSAVLAL